MTLPLAFALMIAATPARATSLSFNKTAKATVSAGSGAELYSPTKCDWLAVELNSNFRVFGTKSGYSLQIYCRAPSTVFLSYHYKDEADHDAALAADDEVRAAVARVVSARGWTWVKVDGEMEKIDGPAPAKTPVVKSSPAPISKPTSVDTETVLEGNTDDEESPKKVTPDEKVIDDTTDEETTDEKPVAKKPAPQPGGNKTGADSDEMPAVVDSVSIKSNDVISLDDLKPVKPRASPAPVTKP